MSPRTRRRSRFEWMALGAALLLLAGIGAYWQYRGHAEIEAFEGERLQNQTRMIEENLARQLEGVANALAGVAADFPRRDVSAAGSALTSHRLAQLTAAMPGVRVIAIFDAQGKVRSASRDNLIGRDFSQREYFQTLRSQPNPATLYVSRPYLTNQGVWSVNLSRALLGARGKFSGIVTAVLEPDYFKILLHSVLYAPDMRISLTHTDGILFVELPPNDGARGKDLASPDSFHTRHRASGQSATLMNGTDYATGEERMMAQRTLLRADLGMDKSLDIGVSRDLAAIYAPWRAGVVRLAMAHGIVALVAVLFLTFRRRRRRAEDRLMLDHQSTQRESEARLHLALQAARMGTFERDILRQRIIWSPEHEALFGYVPGEFDGSERSFAERMHPQDLPGQRAEVARCIAARAPYEYEFRVLWPNGSVHWLVSTGHFEFDASGQATHLRGVTRDIGERKRAEQQIQGQLEELLRWQELIVGREERMRQLKTEVNALLARQDRPPRYPVDDATIGDDK